MTIAHIALPVGTHYLAMRDFYVAILKPLNYELMDDHEEYPYGGFMIKGSRPDFWLVGGRKDENGLQPYDGKLEERVAPVHVAFEAKNRELVDQWYQNAIEVGATDNGKPGERPQYAKGYYAAFVIDPLGNNIEVAYSESWKN